MQTFAELLSDLIKYYRVEPIEIYHDLEDQGVKVSRASFYRYLAGESIPPLSKALAITNALNYDAGDNMVDILNYSSQAAQTEKLKQGMLWTSIKVDYRKFIDSDKAEEIFWNRVNATSNGITDYITKLIIKDLNEGLLVERNKDGTE